jgi:hypothetical protein
MRGLSMTIISKKINNGKDCKRKSVQYTLKRHG